MITSLSDQLRHLPNQPGVYQFFDAAGNLLYVGKAKKLRPRVRSYFRPAATLAQPLASSWVAPDKQLMVARITDLRWTEVDTEWEALLLEATLIKEHHPPFNIVLRDDKSFAYLKINLRDAWPRLEVTRQLQRDGARYFGPYNSMREVRETISTLTRVFHGRRRVHQTTVPEDLRCVQHLPGRCSAFCKSLVPITDYRTTIKRMMEFLEGRHRELLTHVSAAMRQAARHKHFEAAARLRDQLFALERVGQQQKMVRPLGEDADYIALAKAGASAAVTVFAVRRGKLLRAQDIALRHTADRRSGDILAEFCQQYYVQAPDIPPQLFVAEMFNVPKDLMAYAKRQRPGALTIHRVQRGQRAKLLQLAQHNAASFLQRNLEHDTTSTGQAGAGLLQLQAALDLPIVPERIECYDISNIQGRHAVGSMVVFVNGKGQPRQYRSFNIRGKQTPDDFAMLAETVTRRLQHRAWPWPDLLVLDGGKGQLSAVSKAIESHYGPTARQHWPVQPQRIVALAKREEILYRQSGMHFSEIRLPKNSAGYFLIQRIRDEAHRFAITHHRQRRARALVASDLDLIPGIGPASRRALLQHFGSVANIKHAPLEALVKVVGKIRARAVKGNL